MILYNIYIDEGNGFSLDIFSEENGVQKAKNLEEVVDYLFEDLYDDSDHAIIRNKENYNLLILRNMAIISHKVRKFSYLVMVVEKEK